MKTLLLAINDENIVIISKKDYYYVKTQRSEQADYLVYSFDEGARAQNHSLQVTTTRSLDFIGDVELTR